MSPLSSAQCRAARGLLGWSQEELAAKSGLDTRFVCDMEAETGDPGAGQVEALRSTLMAAGVEFTDGDAPGVRFVGHNQGEGTRLGDLTSENDR